MIIADLETWLINNRDQKKIYNVKKKKEVFTPYETNEKFVDEQTFEDMGDYIIEECIKLPDKDILLGMRPVTVASKEKGVYKKITYPMIDYYKLSIIMLSDITNDDDYYGLDWEEDNETIRQS